MRPNETQDQVRWADDRQSTVPVEIAASALVILGLLFRQTAGVCLKEFLLRFAFRGGISGSIHPPLLLDYVFQFLQVVLPATH